MVENEPEQSLMQEKELFGNSKYTWSKNRNMHFLKGLHEEAEIQSKASRYGKSLAFNEYTCYEKKATIDDLK